METVPPLLLAFLSFVAASFLFVFIFQSFSLSPALAYLLTGVALGPEVLGLIPHVEEVRPLGELGVLLLMFMVGLELPLHRLQALRRYVFGLGTAQVFCISLLLMLALWLGGVLSFGGALLVGVTLSFSSTALVVQMISEKGELSTKAGRAAFSILLFQDLTVVLLLIIIKLISLHEVFQWWHILSHLVKSLSILLSMVLAGKWCIAPAFSFITRLRQADVFLLGTLVTLLSFSLFSNYFGLSMELGAFLAGICLADTAYRHHIETELRTLRMLLLGFFFMTVGLEVRLTYLDSLAALGTFLLTVTALWVTKTGATALLGRFFGLEWLACLRLGIWLGGCGEFVFVLFTGDSATASYVPPELMPFIFTLTVASMFATPFLNQIGVFVSARVKRNALPIPLTTLPQEIERTNHVIIVGFGRVGQTLARIFDRNMVSYVAVDWDKERVEQCRKHKFPVIQGDGRDINVLRALSLSECKVLAITVGEPASCLTIVNQVLQDYPNIQICARVKDHEQAVQLAGVGVMMAIPEAIESGLQLASLALQTLGFSMESLEKILKFEKP